MATATHLIERSTIRSLTIGQKVFAGSPPGFGARRTKTGTYWFLRWRTHGKLREISLGSCDKVTQTQARRRAEKFRARIQEGDDPIQARAAKKAAIAAVDSRLSLFKFAERYQRTVPKKPTSRRLDTSLLRLHIIPSLGAMPVADIGREHAQRLHDQMRKTPIMANRAHALLSHMMTEAARLGYRSSPLPRGCVIKYPEVRRERFLSSAEHARLWGVLTAFESGELRDAAQVLKLLLLTGCRKSEIIRLAWSAVDLEQSCLRLADSKTGRRFVPLSREATRVLRSRETSRRTIWVFPARSGSGPRDNIERAWRRVLQASSLDGVRIHDLRHSLAERAIRAGLSLPEIGKLLGHRTHSTTQRYAHVADEVARDAAQRLEEHYGETIGIDRPRLRAI